MPTRRAIGFCWIVVSRSNKKIIALWSQCLCGKINSNVPFLLQMQHDFLGGFIRCDVGSIYPDFG